MKIILKQNSPNPKEKKKSVGPGVKLKLVYMKVMLEYF